MTTPDGENLARLTRRLTITAFASAAAAALSMFMAVWGAAAFLFLLVFYVAVPVLMVSAVGAVMGRLLLAARLDDQPARQRPDQDWFE